MSAMPSNCARIFSKGRSRSSVLTPIWLPLMRYVTSGCTYSSVAAYRSMPDTSVPSPARSSTACLFFTYAKI